MICRCGQPIDGAQAICGACGRDYGRGVFVSALPGPRESAEVLSDLSRSGVRVGEALPNPIPARSVSEWFSIESVLIAHELEVLAPEEVTARIEVVQTLQRLAGDQPLDQWLQGFTAPSRDHLERAQYAREHQSVAWLCAQPLADAGWTAITREAGVIGLAKSEDGLRWLAALAWPERAREVLPADTARFASVLLTLDPDRVTEALLDLALQHRRRVVMAQQFFQGRERTAADFERAVKQLAWLYSAECRAGQLALSDFVAGVLAATLDEPEEDPRDPRSDAEVFAEAVARKDAALQAVPGEGWTPEELARAIATVEQSSPAVIEAITLRLTRTPQRGAGYVLEAGGGRVKLPATPDCPECGKPLTILVAFVMREADPSWADRTVELLQCARCARSEPGSESHYSRLRSSTKEERSASRGGAGLQVTRGDRRAGAAGFVRTAPALECCGRPSIQLEAGDLVLRACANARCRQPTVSEPEERASR